jgi:hypothetical protein
MDVEAALRVLEDLPAQPEQVKQLSPAVRQRILALSKDLPSLILTPEQIAFMQIFEVSTLSRAKEGMIKHHEAAGRGRHDRQ